MRALIIAALVLTLPAPALSGETRAHITCPKGYILVGKRCVRGVRTWLRPSPE